MAEQSSWVKKVYDTDPLTAIKMILSSHATGKIVLNVSQGTVRTVEWCEKKHAEEISLDKVTV